jgi:hybrid cluster-associated redox disulfide protein
MNQATATTSLSLTTLILDVVERFPQTVAVFNDLNIACPGCHISPFHTVADSAHEHGLRPDELLGALNSTVTSGQCPR